MLLDLFVRLDLCQLGELYRIADTLLQVTPGTCALLELRKATHRVLSGDIVGPKVRLLGLSLDAGCFGF